MKIISFSIKDYRSINLARKLPLFDNSILVGPNNEGKSNILQALVLVLSTLANQRFTLRRSTKTSSISFDYDWQRDYPLHKQKTNSGKASEFKIELELNDIEKEEFYKTVKIKISSHLILSLKYYCETTELNVVIAGRVKNKFDTKLRIISQFLNNHITCSYIPAFRTSNYILEIIEDLLAKAFVSLDRDEEFVNALMQLEKYRAPILKELSKSLTKGISEFLPDVKHIKLEQSQSIRRFIRESCKIYVDDGNNTELNQKGDGIKSLLAISLVRHLSKIQLGGQNLILAIEEPESHLHPKAIHKLASAIKEISKEHQVIITTHSPLLVDKKVVEKNIIVYKSKAKAAKNIAELRDILGVKVSDNLVTANLVLIVEGNEDIKIIETWLSARSIDIKNSIENKNLIIDSLKGGSNLSYCVSLYKNFMCDVVAFLDDDPCGLESFNKAKNNGLVEYRDVIFSKCPKRKYSEIEDMIDNKTYIMDIETKYGVKLSNSLFQNKKIVWSNRLKHIFLDQGKQWNDSIENEIKNIVAENVKKVGLKSLKKNCFGPLESLNELLLSRIKLQ